MRSQATIEVVVAFLVIVWLLFSIREAVKKRPPWPPRNPIQIRGFYIVERRILAESGADKLIKLGASEAFLSKPHEWGRRKDAVWLENELSWRSPDGKLIGTVEFEVFRDLATAERYFDRVCEWEWSGGIAAEAFLLAAHGSVEDIEAGERIASLAYNGLVLKSSGASIQPGHRQEATSA